MYHDIYYDLHLSLSVGRSSNSVSKVNGLSATGCEEMEEREEEGIGREREKGEREEEEGGRREEGRRKEGGKQREGGE